jgi:hypothetical protein
MPSVAPLRHVAAFARIGWPESSEYARLLSKIKQRWMMMVDSTTREVFFYVGNLHRFQDIFTVLGVFYPPIKRG